MAKLDANMAVDSWSYSIAEELSKSDHNEYPVDRKAEVTAANLDAGKELLDFEQELIKVKSEGKKCVPYQFKFLHVDEANTGRRIRNSRISTKTANG